MSEEKAAHRTWWTSPRKAVLLFTFALALSVIAAFTATGWNAQFDLRIYYDAMAHWRAGGDLYSYGRPDPIMGSLGFTYPPLAALAMYPMALLPFEMVRIVTLLAIVAAAAALTWLLLADATPLRRGSLAAATAVAVPVVFMVEPLRENLSFGQINIFLALLVVGDFLVLARRGSRWFGAGTALAAALKVTPGIFVLYLAATGRWRAVVTSLAIGAGLTLVGAIVAWEQTWDFFTALLWDTTRVGRYESVLNQSFNGWLARFTAPDPPPRALWAVAAIVIVAGGLWRARNCFRAGDDLAGLAITGLIGITVSPVSWVHHAVWVLPALVVAIGRWWELRGDPAGATRRRWVAALALSGMLAWGMQPTSYIRTEIDLWSEASTLTVVLSGLPVLWCLVAIATLPARQRIPASQRSPLATTGP